METRTKRLEGRAVIVTGGGSGIAEDGGLVGVADIRTRLAEAVAEEINGAGGRAIALSCDVADEDEVANMVARTAEAFGGLYGLVANAGTAGSGWIHETAVEDWNFVLSVNLTGPFLCAEHAIPHMIAGGGGSIVMTSSIAGSVVGAGEIKDEYPATIALLLSDDSGYIAGSAIPVDGGYLAT